MATESAAIGWMHRSTLLAAGSEDAQQPRAASAEPTAGDHIELFGVRLATAKRETLQAALSRLGAVEIRNASEEWPNRYDLRGLLSYKAWFDLYEGKNLLNGADNLEVGYAGEAKLAIIRYTFRDYLSGERTIEMLGEKYGSAKVSRSGFDEEQVWRRDGIVIRAGRKHMSGPYLVYEVPGVLRELDREIETARQETIRRGASQQFNRF